jgi:hypothetical protein
MAPCMAMEHATSELLTSYFRVRTAIGATRGHVGQPGRIDEVQDLP